jgi:hypothetical protein
MSVSVRDFLGFVVNPPPGDPSRTAGSDLLPAGVMNAARLAYVENYGAQGDGVTDDTAAVQAAVNSVSAAGGGVVHFTPGRTYLLGTVTPANNVTVWAYGATLKLNLATAHAMFYYNAAAPLSGWKLLGATFPGTGSETQNQSVFQCNTPGVCADVEIRDNIVTNWATGPFYIGNVIRARVLTNTIRNCCTAGGTNAINFVSQIAAGATQECIATGNLIEACATQGIAYVNTTTTSNQECRVIITGNYVEANGSAVGGGIDIEFASAGIAEGSKFLIANNVVSYTGPSTVSTAIAVNGSSGTDPSLLNRVLVSGNIVDSTSGGLQLVGSQIACVGNVINAAKAAIIAGKSTPNLYQLIAGNVCHAPNTIADSAIIYANGLQHSKIVGNLLLTDASPTGTATSGIQVAAGGWIELLDNTIIAPPRHGILVAGNDYEIRGNRIYNPAAGVAANGIYLNTITGQFCRVIDNTIIDDRGTHLMFMGVQVTSAALAEVVGNRIGGYTGSAISAAVALRSNNKLSSGNAAGKATLVAGTVTVSTAEVQAGDTILLTNVLAGGTVGILSVGAIVAGTSFVINSSSNTDTSTVFWKIEH